MTFFVVLVSEAVQHYMILFFASFALRPRLIYILKYVHCDTSTVYRIFGKEDTGRGVSSRVLV